MAAHGLIQGVNRPTRMTTCIDHIMVKTKNSWQTLVFGELTDHSPILICISTRMCKNATSNKRKTVTDINKVKEMLEQQSWTDYYQLQDANEAANELVSTMQAVEYEL